MSKHGSPSFQIYDTKYIVMLCFRFAFMQVSVNTCHPSLVTKQNIKYRDSIVISHPVVLVITCMTHVILMGSFPEQYTRIHYQFTRLLCLYHPRHVLTLFT